MFDWFNPAMLPWWGWFLAGGLCWFSVNCFALPDSWSTWLGQRRNGPLALLPFGILALIAGGFNVLLGVGWALLEAIGHFASRVVAVRFEPWVVVAAGGGLAIVLFYLVTQSWRRNQGGLR